MLATGLGSKLSAVGSTVSLNSILNSLRYFLKRKYMIQSIRWATILKNVVGNRGNSSEACECSATSYNFPGRYCR